MTQRHDMLRHTLRRNITSRRTKSQNMTLHSVTICYVTPCGVAGVKPHGMFRVKHRKCFPNRTLLTHVYFATLITRYSLYIHHNYCTYTSLSLQITIYKELDTYYKSLHIFFYQFSNRIGQEHDQGYTPGTNKRTVCCHISPATKSSLNYVSQNYTNISYKTFLIQRRIPS